MPQDVKTYHAAYFHQKKKLDKIKTREYNEKKLVEANLKTGMNRSFNKVYTMREVYPGMGAFRKYS